MPSKGSVQEQVKTNATGKRDLISACFSVPVTVLCTESVNVYMIDVALFSVVLVWENRRIKESEVNVKWDVLYVGRNSVL
jgi:hypothetical protein